MNPETAMRQAGMTAIKYTATCLEYLNKYADTEGLQLSDEAKLQCASRMALAASIDFAAAVFSGQVSGYPGLAAQIAGNLSIEQL